jgi:hypothetical protein
VVARYVACPGCARTINARAESCPHCGLDPNGPIAVTDAPRPPREFDVVGGCLLAVLLILGYFLYIVWLLGPAPAAV